MATALQLPHTDRKPDLNEVALGLVSPHAHTNSFSQRLSISELDLKDNRYPSLAVSGSQPIPSQSRQSGYSGVGDATPPNPQRGSWVEYQAGNAYTNMWTAEKVTEEPAEEATPAQNSSPNMTHQVQPADGPLPRSLQPASGTPPADRYSWEEQLRRSPNGGAGDASAPYQEMGQRASRFSRDPSGSMSPAAPRPPSQLSPGNGAGPSSSPKAPMISLTAGPSYSPSMQIPISPKPRAYAQHPTYITPAAGDNMMRAAYAPPQVPREEVCVECAMRDQDMADVDVTSPGVWERESDGPYHELLRIEEEEEASGIVQPENSPRPKAKGGKLTEENLQIWLSINPKEPSSRQQTLDMYVRSQRSLIEAEVLAHARAMRESRLIEDRMRDTYSQLRRSAYELGHSAHPSEDNGGLRIKAPRSASMPSGVAVAVNHDHSREVTLLENGMIVEHVDVRREEKEERERRRKEERRERSRARKSSRGSAIDVASIYSMPIPSQVPHADSGFFSGMRGSESRYSQSFSPRPSSIVTTEGRPHMLPRAYSQASFSDLQSVGSNNSPRRSRFFGFKNLSSGWRSSDSLAPSGSMVDMHVALQREQAYMQAHPGMERNSIASPLHLGESWPVDDPSPERTITVSPTPSKKKTGLKKIWKLVTGSSKVTPNATGAREPRSPERGEDDAPLAPPPPLSYLVDRERGLSTRRHLSTPSLPSTVSPNAPSPFPQSPPTAPSSAIPSPTSSRQGADKDNASDSRKDSGNHHSDQEQESRVPSTQRHSPDPDSRGRSIQGSMSKASSQGASSLMPPSNRPLSTAIRRDKSLPPIPAAGESTIEFPNHPMPEIRPQTMYNYNTLQLPPSASGAPGQYTLLPPQAPFRTGEARRQSFGGLGSKPHPAARTVPARGPPPPLLLDGGRYTEFGASQASLTAGQWPSPDSLRAEAPSQKPKWRRSRFGLSSLFGKHKGQEASDGVANVNVNLNALGGGAFAATMPQSNGHPQSSGSPDGQEFGTLRASATASDLRSESGYGRADSAHSSSAPRMSVASRKNLAELVEQDAEFVAYRYPSGEQRLDLAR